MNRLGLCVHGLGPKHGVVCWCGCCCGGGGGGVGVGANSIPKIWHTQDLVTYACNMSWRWHTPDIETTLLLGREVRVDGRWGRGRQGTSALPLLHVAPLRVVHRVAFVPRKGAFFLHLVFCPPEVGLTQASLAGALWVLASGLMACGLWFATSASGTSSVSGQETTSCFALPLKTPSRRRRLEKFTSSPNTPTHSR